MEDASATSADQDPLPMELPPNTVLVEPSDDFSETEALSQSAVSNDVHVIDTEDTVRSSTLHVGNPESVIEPKSMIAGQALAQSLTQDEKPVEFVPNPTEDRGWLHRDLLTNTTNVPLSLNSDQNVGTSTEMPMEVKAQADANGIPNLPPHTAVVQPLDEAPFSLNSQALETQAKEVGLSGDHRDVPDQVLDERVASKPSIVNAMSEQCGDSPQSTKSSSSSLTTKTTNVEAKKNRLLDILNARTKDLSMSAKKDPLNKPSRFIGSGDSFDSIDGEPPSNTAVIHSSSSTPEPMEITEGDSAELDAKNEQSIIINKPVTQIMGTSKRKAKKPLPKRSSLESMIVAASDPTDFFSIANTLDDSEEEGVLLVDVDEPVDPNSSQDAKVPEETQTQVDNTLQNTPHTVEYVPTAPVCTTLGVAGQFNTVTVSQPFSSVAANTIQTFVSRPPKLQSPTPQTFLAVQQPIQSSPPNQVQQQTHYVQHVLQPHQPQLSLLQQKLMQPVQQGSLLPQGQILVQGNIMQGSILQTSLTSVDGVQQAVSTGNLILQQQQAPQQYVQQVPMGQSVLQQTAVLPTVYPYQGNVPIIQQQTAQPIPPQQANSTVFAYSSSTPTVIKPQQTVFLLQRGDILKLDSLGNLIVIGKEDANTSQVPVVQPGSSILTVGSVKNLLSSRQPSSAPATQELVPQPVVANPSTQHHIVTVTRTVQSKGTPTQVNPPANTQAAVTNFNRPVVLGKQPVASVQPQRQKALCPNPELIRTRPLNVSTGPTSPFTEQSMCTSDVKVKMSFVETTANTPKPGGIKIFQCEKCKKLFVSKASLFNHLAAEMHTDNQPLHVKLPYKCNTCEARFAFKASLTFHTNRSCLPERAVFNIICSHCKLRFKTLIDLERHGVRCHHLLPSQNPEFVDQDPEEKYEKVVVTPSPVVPSKPVTPVSVTSTPQNNTTSDKWQVAHRTEVQARNFQLPETLDQKPPIKLVMSMKRKKKKKHRGKKRKYSMDDPSSASGITVIKAEDANTRNIINLYGKFLNKSPRPFSCQICSKGFTSEHCLLEHIKTHIKPFSCGKCGWKSARKDNVLKHIQLRHGGPKYQKKRQGKHRKDATPTTSEDEADDHEGTSVEDAHQLNAGEEDLSDPEDPDIELEDNDDDQPHDYFGSKKYDGPDDDDDDDDKGDDEGDNGNSGGSSNKDNGKDSDGQTDGDMPDGQDDNDGNGTTTPAPQDHNYLTQMQQDSDSTRPTQMENRSPDFKNDRVPISGEPTTVPDSGATSPELEQPEMPSQESSLSASEKSQVPPDSAERDGDKDCHTKCKEANHSTGPHPKTLLEVACPSTHSDTKNCALPEVSDLDRCTHTTSEVNNNHGGEKPYTEGHPTENAHLVLEEAKDDGSTTGKHLTTEKDANFKEIQSQDRLQTSSVIQQKELANEGTHSSQNVLEITSAGSQRPSLENRCVDTIVGSDLDSDGDMDWISEHDGSNEDSAFLEDDSPKRPILLRDEEGGQLNSSLISNDSVFIDDDNLEIRPNVKHVQNDKRNLDDYDDDDYDDSSDIASNSYYTVLNAEGTDGDEPQEECSVMDETENTLIVDSGESENVAHQLTEMLEMECQEDEDEKRSTDPSQFHAKCNVDLEVRVKTEDLLEDNVPNAYISEACRPGSSQKRLDQKVTAEDFNVSEHRIRRCSRELLTPEEHLGENTETNSQQPKQHDKFPSRSAVKVKQEIIELHEEDAQYSKGNDYEDLNKCEKRQAEAVNLVCELQMAEAHNGIQQQSDKRGNFYFGQEMTNLISGQSQVAPSSDLRSTDAQSHANESSTESSKQVLPVITAVGSLKEPGNHIEGVNQQRKSAILDSLNRPSRPFPPAQPFGPTSGYDPRVMYNSIGLPMANPLPGQQFLPRYPHTGNPYISMFHSGSMVDPREQCYPGHAAISAAPAMGCNSRLPHMGLSLPESRFPHSNGFPPQIPTRREGYPYQQEPNAVDKRFSVHQENYSQFNPHKLSKRDRQKHRHLRRHFPDPQQNDYHHHSPAGLAPQPSFLPASPGSSHAERFMYPKHPYEERVGCPMTMMSSPDQFYQATGARHLHQEANPCDLPIVSRPHEYGEIARRPVQLERNISHGPPSQSSGPLSIPNGPHTLPSGTHSLPSGPHSLPSGPHSLPSGPLSVPNGPPSIPNGPPYANEPRIPARQPGPAEASTPIRPPAPLLRPCLPGSVNPTLNINEPVPDHEMNMARQGSHELQSGNDKPPPLVYQGPKNPQDLSCQKNEENEQGGLIVKDISVGDSSQKDACQKSKDIWSDSGRTGQFPEHAQITQNDAVLQEATFSGNGMQLYAKPPPPSVPAPPPPPPPPPPLNTSYSSQPGRLQYSLEDSISDGNTQPPVAHQHHSPPDYLAGANAPFGAAPIHVGPSHVPPILPNPQSVLTSPSKDHTSSESTDQQPAQRRRKKSLRSEESPEERPYACHICGSRFKRSNNLTDHVRIHSRPYKCGECNFDTTRWQYLADHLKKNHNFEGDARELEMMFKSGKRLKPTDHIPETCYQPIISETNNNITTSHPIRNGFSPGSKSMVVPTSTLVPRGTDIVPRDKSRKRKHNDEYPDEDLVDFFGHSSSQDDEDATVAPVTKPETGAKDDLDDAASGSANGAQISPGSAHAQTSPKGNPITSPKSEPIWSKRKQLMPIKVTDDAPIKNELESETQTNEETVEKTETIEKYELMISEMEKQIIKEDVNDIKQLDDHEEIIAAECNESVAEHVQESETDLEKEEGDESDHECSPTYVASPVVQNTTEESEEDILFTPTGRPKRRSSSNSLSPRERMRSENEDPEYTPNKPSSWKKRSLKMKIHFKRSKNRGRSRKRPVSDSSNTRVEALSTHVGGGLDLSPYYAIVEPSDGDLDRRPYECRINECNKRFKSKQHMREHLFTHLKPYKCDACGIGFARTDYLAMHMRDMHKMSPTRMDLYNKRKCANGRAMACRMRPSKDRRRQELQQSFQNGKEL